MSGPDAMHGEMPGFIPGRPGGEHDEPLLDTIFDRRPLPPGAPPEMRALVRTLAAAAGPAEPGELAGEAAALAAFSGLAPSGGVSPAAQRPARRWLSGWPARGRLPLTAALVAAAAGLGSIVAAYVGVLPGPIQEMAHVTVGAPAASGGNDPLTHVAPSRSRSSPRVTDSSGHPQTRPAGPAPAPSQATSPQPHRKPTGRSTGHPVPNCTPGSARTTPKPSPTQYPPTPGPGQPVWTPRPSATAGCPVIVTQPSSSPTR